MNFLKIESFLKIIEAGSINKAAEELFISQSTLSDRLTTLEEGVDAILIKRRRGTRSIELTEAGIEFIAYAKRYVELMNEIEDWKTGGQRRQLNIAAPLSINSHFMKTFFMNQLNSDAYHINISSQWNHITYQMIQKYDLDIGFVSTPYFSNAVKTEALYSEPMVVIYDARHSDYQSAKMSDLKVEDEIHLGWGPDYENWHNGIWSMSHHPLTSVDSPDLILEFLKTENSWAVVPLVVYDQFKDLRPSVKIINSKKMFSRKIYLVRQQSENPSYLKKIASFSADLEGYLEYMETAGFCELNQ